MVYHSRMWVLVEHPVVTSSSHPLSIIQRVQRNNFLLALLSALCFAVVVYLLDDGLFLFGFRHISTKMMSFKVTSAVLALFLLQDTDAFTPRNLAAERSRSVSSALPMVRHIVMPSRWNREKQNLLVTRESVCRESYPP